MADDPLDFLNDPDARMPPRPPPVPPGYPGAGSRRQRGLNAKIIWGIVLVVLGLPAAIASVNPSNLERPERRDAGSLGALTLIGGGVLIYFGYKQLNDPKPAIGRQRQQFVQQQQQAVQQQQRQQWLLGMAALMRAEDIGPLAMSVYQHLLAIDARLRVGFETAVFPAEVLCDLLGASLVNLEQLSAQRSCPAFSEVAKTAHNLYRDIVRLKQTFPRERPYLIGGGFGVRGAAEGIAIAGGINWLLNQPARRNQSLAANAMADNVQNAHTLLQLLRDRCSTTSN